MGAFQLPGVIECGEPPAPLPPDPHYQWMGGGGRGVVSQKSILLGVTQYSISDLETFLLTADPLHIPIRKAPYSVFTFLCPFFSSRSLRIESYHFCQQIFDRVNGVICCLCCQDDNIRNNEGQDSHNKGRLTLGTFDRVRQ